METAVVPQSKPMGMLEQYRTRIMIAAGTAGTTLVGFASAAVFDLNATVGPLVDGIVALIPSLTNLVLGLIPLIIVMAVAKFFPDLFDSILAKLRM